MRRYPTTRRLQQRAYTRRRRERTYAARRARSSHRRRRDGRRKSGDRASGRKNERKTREAARRRRLRGGRPGCGQRARCAFAAALGLEMDASGFGMGQRSQRYSMLVKDGTVTELNVEQGGGFEVSSADYLLGQL